MNNDFFALSTPDGRLQAVALHQPCSLIPVVSIIGSADRSDVHFSVSLLLFWAYVNLMTKHQRHERANKESEQHGEAAVKLDIPNTDRDSIEADLRAATALWKPVGVFTFLASIAVWAAMAGEERIIAENILKLSKPDAYAIALFAIPLISLTLISQCIIGTVYASSKSSIQKRTDKIPTLVPELEGSSLRRRIAILSLLAFVLLPSCVLTLVTAKFFSGKYYYSADPARGCGPDEKCDDMGNFLYHFYPKKPIYLSDLWNSHYRYQGDKTYIPIVFPLFFILLTGIGILYCVRYLSVLIFGK